MASAEGGFAQPCLCLGTPTLLATTILKTVFHWSDSSSDNSATRYPHSLPSPPAFSTGRPRSCNLTFEPELEVSRKQYLGGRCRRSAAISTCTLFGELLILRPPARVFPPLARPHEAAHRHCTRGSRVQGLCSDSASELALSTPRRARVAIWETSSSRLAYGYSQVLDTLLNLHEFSA